MYLAFIHTNSCRTTKINDYLSSIADFNFPPVDIVVNSTKPDEINASYFSPKDNVIVLGRGDGSERTAMTAPDVVAHEYLHYLQQFQNSLTSVTFSLLIKEKEPGALRESIADIFGEIIEDHCYGKNDWVFGGQVMTAESGKQGIRSLSNPKDGNMVSITPDVHLEYPWEEIEEGCEPNDRCGIHTNCGVQNHWFYILANSIGLDDATKITLGNYLDLFSENLNSTALYKDAAAGSIKIAEEIYGKNSIQLIKVIEAWEKVGVKLNSMQWKLEPTNVTVGGIFDEVKFDLVIDSAGQDISADGLNITLHMDEKHQRLTKEDFVIYPPLTKEEVSLEFGFNEVTITIERLTTINAQKKEDLIKKIISNTPILGITICIVMEDAGDTYCYPPINLSGYTEITPNLDIVFEPDILPLGSCINKNDLAEGFNLLYTSLNISNKSCNSFGSIEIEVLNNDIVQGFALFTYTLFKDDIAATSTTKNETNHSFDNLDEGYYTIILKDNKKGKANIEFEIRFVAETYGSICCPENLTIPHGTIE